VWTQKRKLRTHRGVHSFGVGPAAGDTARRPNCTRIKAVQWI
jgi:hypothetical protein